MDQTAIRRFHKLSLYTLIAVYFLVLVGGVVRSTGSGMGCPDWPKCFGQWTPPTSVTELPENYKEQYAAYREKKNQKFARYLSLIGLEETATRIRDDKSILMEADFNAARTLVEYANRVVGVIIGLMIIALFAASWKVRASNPDLFRGALASLLLVIIQGWFGSIVVSTNLTAWTVTVHMFLALLIVVILVRLMVRSGTSRPVLGSQIRTWLMAGMAVLLVQIFLGTQVRESIDGLVATFNRTEWIGRLGVDFLLHRSFSWVVIAVQAGLWLKLRKTTTEKSLTLIPFVLILLSVLTGTGMAYFAVPALLQPVHLVLAVVTFGWYVQLYYAAAQQSESVV